jgi:hypothetical protein
MDIDETVDWGKLSKSLFRQWHIVVIPIEFLGRLTCPEGYLLYLANALRRENWAGEG